MFYQEMIERERNIPNKSILFRPNHLIIKITELVNKNLQKELKSALVSDTDEQYQWIH